MGGNEVAEESGWIPVEERMPEPGVYVLVWSTWENQDPSIAEYCPDRPDCIEGEEVTYWRNDGEGMGVFGVTHWMPLPSPPQTEG
jgi:Protein of unknown function (DUF551)